MKKKTKKELIKDEIEYHKLNRVYRSLAGKWFKRNGLEMHQNLTKLEAIKIRLAKLQDQEDTTDFSLRGAL